MHANYEGHITPKAEQLNNVTFPLHIYLIGSPFL